MLRPERQNPRLSVLEQIERIKLAESQPLSLQEINTSNRKLHLRYSWHTHALHRAFAHHMHTCIRTHDSHHTRAICMTQTSIAYSGSGALQRLHLLPSSSSGNSAKVSSLLAFAGLRWRRRWRSVQQLALHLLDLARLAVDNLRVAAFRGLCLTLCFLFLRLGILLQALHQLP